jgi:hypothetical protein
MAVSIPIITEFDGKGIGRAVEEFKQLEGAGAKAQFALKKAVVPATAAIAGLAAGLGAATKAAIEDQAAQEALAGVLRRSALATDEEVAATEAFISAQSRLTATADDELRPALQSLAVATGSVQQAQDLLKVSQDLAAISGADLATVTDAMSKAANGNMKALRALDPSLTALIKEGASFDDVLVALTLHQGAAADAANTTQGKMRNLSIQMGEAKESIGAALLPAVTLLIEKLIPLAEFAQQNSKLFLIFAGVIGGVALAVLAVNAAMKVYQATLIVVKAAQAAFNLVMAANPIGIVIVALAALAAAFVVAYQNSETFRKFVDELFDAIKTGVEFSVKFLKNYLDEIFDFFGDVFGPLIDGIQTALSLIGRLAGAIRSLPSLPNIGGAIGGLVGKLPGLASGGIVTRPTVALIGERGPEAVIPLNKPNAMGNTTVNVYSTVADATLPDVIVNALRQYNRRNGVIDIAVA